MGSQTRSRRIPELDALRGLAAVAVLLGHWLTVVPAWVADTRNLPGYGLLNLFKYTPLSVFTAAYEAVLVFFVLSGFVLALPFLEGRGGSYRSFLVRRAFRIYPVAWVAAGAAMAAVAILGTHGLPERDGVVGLSWQAMPTPALLLGHGTLLTSFDASAFDPPLWSLVDELRISLVFPILFAVVVRTGAWRASVVAGAVAVVLSLGAWPLSMQHDSARTAVHVVCFVLGIALAQRRHALVRPRHWAAWALVLVLLTSPYTFLPWSVPLSAMPSLRLVLPTLGACGLIVLVQSGWASALLRRRLPAFLGDVSYSVYLFHMPILLGLLHAAPGVNPILLAPAGIALTFAVSAVSRKVVEVPLIRVGARLARGRLRSGHERNLAHRTPSLIET